MSEPEVRELLEAAERVFVERPDLLASFLDEFGEFAAPTDPRSR